MLFNSLYCNGKQNPIGTGEDILLQWNYKNDGKRNERQTAFQIQVTDGKTTFDSGVCSGAEMQYPLSAHMKLKPGKEYHWTVTAWTNTTECLSATAAFETASDCIEKAAWLTAGEKDFSSPVFMKECHFQHKAVQSARAYVFGLGFYRLYINGRDTTNAVLMPPNARYDKVCYYKTIDITPFVDKDDCLVEIQLGHGYNQDFSRFGYRYEGSMGVRAAFKVQYTDGTSKTVYTGEGWNVRPSPIVINGIYAGEQYDARLTDFAAHPAVVSPDLAPKGELIPDEMPPIRVIKELTPVNSWQVGEDTIYDFGSNLSGYARIQVVAEEGCIIRLKHAEMLAASEDLDTETNREAEAEDIYICAGGGEEVYTPRFTYHGFRYICVSGLANVKKFSIMALMISTELENRSTFLCSEPVINRIHELCVHGLLCNHVSIPTDCPVRDERTPCQMDSQGTEVASIYNFHMSAYYTKWLTDLVNADFSEGEMNPDWRGDLITLVYRMYLYYNDLRPAVKYYEQMRSYVQWWDANRVDGVWEKGFGDWCLPNDNTWETVGDCRMAVNTSLLYSYTDVLSELAGLLGKEEDIPYFKDLGKDIADAMIRKYLHENGEIGTGRQTEEIMTLFMDMLTGETKKKVVQALEARLVKERNLDTGGYGTMAFLEVLADNGLVDNAFTALTETSYPGFGWEIANGATSLWEQWAYRGIMHSHNHAFFAGIDSSFYRVFCGVRPLAPAFRRFRIKPVLPKDLRFAACTIGTVSGDISVNVEKISDGLALSLTIPANTEAEVVLPAELLSEEYVWFDGEVQMEKAEVLRLGSGTYMLRTVPKKYLYEK